ncbi:MAG: trypsin-like peptidase domain-containing protein [Anaerolineae bacterium]|nr:trypsin-like peptidase domain-containing protein [Anaerolineae bacterium]
MSMRAKHLPLVALALMVLLAWFGSDMAAAQGPRQHDANLPTVVQLTAVDEGRGGRLTAKWTGTGTLISADGLILTNCQVAIPRVIWDDRLFDYDLLVVSLVVQPGQPPQPTYVAEVVQYDAALDLAVARITQRLDGSPVTPRSLGLPFASVGDSDALQAGDSLQVLGYPGLGADMASLEAQVTRFASGRGVAGRAWIGTDADLGGGISGAPAFDAQGSVVGVVAVGAAGSADDVLHCRYMDDTNGDGLVDQNDQCTNTGGSTNAIRPINLAATIIQAASLGVEPQPTSLPFPTAIPQPTVTPEPEATVTPGPRPTPRPVGPRITRAIFAPAINEYDQPVTVVQSFPSGTEDIFLVFDFAGFVDGPVFQPMLDYEGTLYDNIWSPYSWGWGPTGTSWLSIHAEPLADGLYQFILYFDNQEVGTASVRVGGPADTGPSLANITFTAGGAKGYLLPAGADRVDVTFDYRNMTPSDSWSYVWYLDGEEIDSGQGGTLPGTSGTADFALTARGGLEEGVFRLDLYVGDRLSATSDFLATSQAEQDFFGPITFAEGVDRNDQPVNPGTVFRYGLKELYAFFDYRGMQDGWEWSRQWYIDGRSVTSMADTWAFGESGEDFWVAINSSRDPLPQGEYLLELYVRGELVQQATCTIGGGPAPTPTPLPPRAGVEMYGTIYDAATGRGIKGAFFLVLQPGITTATFTWDENQVYTWAETDQWGYYELALPLVRGETYSMIVGAEGYVLIAEDGIYIGQDAEPSYQIDIALTRIR